MQVWLQILHIMGNEKIEQEVAHSKILECDNSVPKAIPPPLNLPLITAAQWFLLILIYSIAILWDVYFLIYRAI